ncbi:MAG: M56 family metallopeptidase [Bacteroidales bacterium]|nr:M56 family metallopeptidase [Clostridium sp.]MCM1203818.1 M56 family metallopeptidase [Bacteroidales bacterium]
MNYKMIMEFITVHSAYVVPGVLSATIAGSVAYGIWLFLSRRTAKFYITHSMLLIRLCFFCFLAPLIPFGIFQIREWTGVFNGREMIISTDKLGLVMLYTTMIWMLITAVILVYRWIHYQGKCRLCRENKPVEDREILEMVENWQKALGIKKKVALYCNGHISSPALLYHKGYQILLPELSMTKNEMNIVILHELMHLKHGDIRLKNNAFVVNAIHSFNPIAYHLRKELTIWEEVNCDRACCEAGKGSFTVKEYFSAIVQLKEKSLAKRNETDTLCCLNEDIKLLEFRVDMAAGIKGEKRKIRIAEVIFAVLLAVSVMFVSSTVVAKGFTVLVDKTLETHEIDAGGSAALRETSVRALFGDADMPVYEEEISGRTEETKITLAPGEVMAFVLPECGNGVSCIGLVQEEAKYQFGIIDDREQVLYAESADTIHVEYPMRDGHGRYFFVRNMGETEQKLEIFISKWE